MIDGVKIKKLKVIPDERGRLMEILRRDDELFQNFGQAYATTTTPASSRPGTSTRSRPTTSPASPA
jgi:dTDP-4-dehydrorhamnose 3,5-epimerase-like enzyme